MLTAEENELLTRVGPGTPGGEMMRRYWQPVALSAEVAPGVAPLPLRILGEDLVLFRNPSTGSGQAAQPGLIGLHCSHRGADLSYGRLEDGGLRCIYHGWLYAIDGRCLEQPGEPPGSTFHERIQHRAYPCHEAAGAIFAYMGPGEPPLFPNYEPFRMPDDHVWLYKYQHECSYLQGNEGNFDPTHAFFLHRVFPGSSMPQGRDPKNAGRPPAELLAQGARSTVWGEPMDCGVRITRFLPGPEWTDVYTAYFVLPNTCTLGGGQVPIGDGHLMNWHVPIDDTHHWRFSMAFRRSAPIDRSRDRERASVTDSDYRFIRNQSNRYLQDREEQRRETFSGLGPTFVVHDSYATETAGAIQDRTQEHLGAADVGIVMARRLLLRAIRDVQEGRDPPHVVRNPAENHFDHVAVRGERIPVSMSWDEYRQRRALPQYRGARSSLAPTRGEPGRAARASQAG